MLQRVATIPEAKSVLFQRALCEGYVQHIAAGSFEKEDFRVQLPMAALEITHPHEDMVPVPPTWDWPAEQTIETCRKYFEDYILSPHRPLTALESEYTYGERMNAAFQFNDAIKKLRTARDTNQSATVIASVQDESLRYPACLRDIHYKYFNGRLHMYTHWRSHDLYAGFGENMVGLAMLLKYVAREASIERTGSIFYTSSGSHIYGSSLVVVR